MIALCLDDEPLLLKELQRILGRMSEITEIGAFTDELKALEDLYLCAGEPAL